MDWFTGQLLDHLEQQGMSENTLVIFSSDNGPVVNDGYNDGSDLLLGDHQPGGPFRGGKYSAFEAGTRVPFITSWPGVTKPGESDALLSQVDIFASLATMLGHQLEKGQAPDSHDIWTVLTGHSGTGREYMLAESYTLSLRKGKYKYIHPQDPQSQGWIESRKGIESGLLEQPQLYDLLVDPGETRNIAVSEKQMLREMRRELKRIVGE
jgi:arylsulfatase A-like enzyme